MLTRWTLSNFKSFKSVQPIGLTSVNVIAGANSSGKSSIIQSILVLKQTLQYGPANRSLSLNGPLLRLGSFSDVLNSSASGELLELGFEMELEQADLRTSPWARSLAMFRTQSANRAKQSLRLHVRFRQKDAESRANQGRRAESIVPALDSVRLDLLTTEEKEPRVYFAEYSLRESKTQSLFSLTVPYAVEIDEESERKVTEKRPTSSIESGTTSHFLPSYFAIKYDAAKKDVMELVENVFSGPFSWSRDLEGKDLPVIAAELANEFLREHEKELLPVDKSTISAASVQKALEPFTRQTAFLPNILKTRESTRIELATLRETIRAAVVGVTEPKFEEDFDTAPDIQAASTYIAEYFKSGVKYLGPLRDAPKPVYQPEALESTTDVGYRGEHTAAVLDLNATRRIRYTAPPSGTTWDFPANKEAKTSSLQSAVVEWLKYLEVADDVATFDEGVFGNRLQVSTSNTGFFHDLTNVGVGVSQVLPIVVSSLLAPPKSLLIFEQPELHLHPKVQARLADFFIALAFDDKQTLLETHSEYLIDRFRLRIAATSDERLLSMINIQFSEKTGSSSSLTAVEINEFGSVINWPKDFFDQSQRDVARIIRAATAKRKASRD